MSKLKKARERLQSEMEQFGTLQDTVLFRKDLARLLRASEQAEELAQAVLEANGDIVWRRDVQLAREILGED